MEEDINKEIFTGKSLDPITIEGTERILLQMKNCIFKIIKKMVKKEQDFFAKFLFQTMTFCLY